MSSKTVVTIVIFLVLLGGAYFVAKKVKHALFPTPVAQQTILPTQAPPATPTTPSDASPSASQTFTIEGNEFAFTPSTITATQGQPLTIVFKNTGKYPHNLTIADLNVKTKTIKPGDQDTLTFTPNQTGKFSFACTVPSHTQKGMTGTLTVQ